MQQRTTHASVAREAVVELVDETRSDGWKQGWSERLSAMERRIMEMESEKAAKDELEVDQLKRLTEQCCKQIYMGGGGRDMKRNLLVISLRTLDSPAERA